MRTIDTVYCILYGTVWCFDEFHVFQPFVEWSNYQNRIRYFNIFFQKQNTKSANVSNGSKKTRENRFFREQF
jgi:hypothetical protein